MATTISRQPRATSVRGASYGGYSEPSSRNLTPFTERVSIQTPYGGGFADRSLSTTITDLPDRTFGDYAVERMRERFGNTPDQIRDRENAGRDRYNAFLADRGIESDTIGSARLVGNSSNRSMALPSFNQEWEAVNLADQAAADSSRLRIAANDARRRGRGDIWADINNQLATREGVRGGRSSELNRDYWLNRLQSAYDTRLANGFAPY